MALLFQGAAFCPSCGAARSRSEEAQPHSTKCPACRGDMHWIRIGDVDLLECASCDGTWIEAAAFERLCAQREQQAIIVQKGADSRTAAARALTGARSRAVPPLPAVRKNDEPAEFRPAVWARSSIRAAPRNVSRSRGASPGGAIHSRRRLRSHAPGRTGTAERRTTAAERAGAASESVARRTGIGVPGFRGSGSGSGSEFWFWRRATSITTISTQNPEPVVSSSECSASATLDPAKCLASSTICPT